MYTYYAIIIILLHYLYVFSYAFEKNPPSIISSQQQALIALIFPVIGHVQRRVDTENQKRMGDSNRKMLFISSSIKKITLQLAPLCLHACLRTYTYSYIY